MKNSICAISVYYGKFNNYFKLWLKSCEYNKAIDFLIITDIVYNGILPQNVKIIKMPLAEIEKRASRILGFEVKIKKPYKLCDYRPLFGLIFSDYLKEYSFWGHNDMDMVYGDIRSFLIQYSFEKYDKFLPLGHLAFYRNDDTVNHYYELEGSQCGSYKNVLQNENVLGFDEVRGIGSIILNNKKSFFFKRIFADITTIYSRFNISPAAAVDGVYEPNYKYQIFYWEKGHVYREYLEKGCIKKQEFIYIHLLKRPNYTVNFDVDETDSFYITPKGFIPKKERVSLEIIQKYNPYKSMLYEKMEFALWVIKKILKKVCM